MAAATLLASLTFSTKLLAEALHWTTLVALVTVKKEEEKDESVLVFLGGSHCNTSKQRGSFSE